MRAEGISGRDSAMIDAKRERLAQVKTRLNAIRVESMERETEAEQLKAEMYRLTRALDHEDYYVDGIKVTEHAILRYLERHLGIDPQEIAEKIAGDTKFQQVVGTVSSGEIPIHEGLKARVCDKVVVTVIKV